MVFNQFSFPEILCKCTRGEREGERAASALFYFFIIIIEMGMSFAGWKMVKLLIVWIFVCLHSSLDRDSSG